MDFGNPAGISRSGWVIVIDHFFWARGFSGTVLKGCWFDSHEKSNRSLANVLGSMRGQDLGR